MTQSSSPSPAAFAVSLVPVAFVAALLVGSTLARAEDQPFSLSFSENYSHDSNVFRQPDKGEVSADWISNTGLGLTLDKSYGRQEYRANVSAGHAQYRRNNQLNNNYYDANLGFASEIASDFKLSLNGDSAQSIATFDNGIGNPNEKNPLHSTTLGGQLQYGLYGRMSLYGGFNHSSQRYDIANVNFPDRRLNTSNIGAQYSPGGNSSFGIGLRHGTGGNGYGGSSSSLDDKIKRNDLDFSAAWQITGFSVFNSRVSLTHEGHSDPAVNDSKTVTWQIGWNYTPTGKLSFNSFMIRDTSNGSTGGQTVFVPSLTVGTTVFGSNEFVNSPLINNSITNSIGTTANWQATSKIKVTTQLSFSQIQSHFVDAADSTHNRSANSHYTSYGLSASYDVLRHLNVSCGAQKLSRSADHINTLGFKATELNCMGAYTLGGL